MGSNAADELVATFMAVTDVSDTNIAKSYLEMGGNQLEMAVSLYMDNSQTPASSSVAGTIPNATVGPSTGGTDEYRAPMEAFEDQILETSDRQTHERVEKDHLEMQKRMAFCDDLGKSAGRVNGSSKHSTGSVSVNRSSKGSSEIPDGLLDSCSALNSIFAAPSYAENGSFADALGKAKEEQKFLLVNIQKKEEFSSHCLNRDIWSNDTIECIVQAHFVFWQRDDVSEQGNQFLKYYPCESLPHILAIDPRTHRCLRKWGGKKWSDPFTAAEYISTFTDKFHFEEPVLVLAGATFEPVEIAADKIAADKIAADKIAADKIAADRIADAGLNTGRAEKNGPTPESIGHARPESGENAEPNSKRPRSAGRPGSARLARPDRNVGCKDVPEMPEEPTDAGAVKITLRLPDGKRSNPVKILPSHTLDRIYCIAAATLGVDVRDIDVLTQFPTKSLRVIGIDKTVQDAGVANSMLLVKKVS